MNYRHHFVGPVTNAYMQNVERMWGSAKWSNKRHRGAARHHLESYLVEFMRWQQIKSNNALDALLDVMKTVLVEYRGVLYFNQNRQI
jgi:hypothetical protein